MRLARYTAAQATQHDMNELDNDSDARSEDSGTDHLSEQSEYSEEKSFDEYTVNPVAASEDGENTASASAALERPRKRLKTSQFCSGTTSRQ